MPRYRVNASVLRLRAGDTFESDDPFYLPFATGGYITVVEPSEPLEGDEDPETGSEAGSGAATALLDPVDGEE